MSQYRPPKDNQSQDPASASALTSSYTIRAGVFGALLDLQRVRHGVSTLDSCSAPRCMPLSWLSLPATGGGGFEQHILPPDQGRKPS
jgi:hypothetical protein